MYPRPSDGNSVIAVNAFAPQTECTRETYITGEVEIVGWTPGFAGGGQTPNCPLVWNASPTAHERALSDASSTTAEKYYRTLTTVGNGSSATETEFYTLRSAITTALNAWNA